MLCCVSLVLKERAPAYCIPRPWLCVEPAFLGGSSVLAMLQPQSVCSRQPPLLGLLLLPPPLWQPSLPRPHKCTASAGGLLASLPPCFPRSPPSYHNFASLFNF